MVRKPSEKEQEYFIAQEVQRLKSLREKHLKKQTDEERRKQRELHHMHCAKCGQKMSTTNLEGIEIEVCADCGGMYLDAGELRKILDEKRRTPFAKALAFTRKLWGQEVKSEK